MINPWYPHSNLIVIGLSPLYPQYIPISPLHPHLYPIKSPFLLIHHYPVVRNIIPIIPRLWLVAYHQIIFFALINFIPFYPVKFHEITILDGLTMLSSNKILQTGWFNGPIHPFFRTIWGDGRVPAALPHAAAPSHGGLVVTGGQPNAAARGAVPLRNFLKLFFLQNLDQ